MSYVIVAWQSRERVQDAKLVGRGHVGEARIFRSARAAKTWGAEHLRNMYFRIIRLHLEEADGSQERIEADRR